MMGFHLMNSLSRRSFLAAQLGTLAARGAAGQSGPTSSSAWATTTAGTKPATTGTRTSARRCWTRWPRRGLRFDRFYSAAPVCSPTRGSIMTGRHPNRYGAFAPNFSIRPEEITLPQLLKPAGYACGHFGKWHLGPVKAGSPTNPGAMGFDTWLSHDNFFEMNPPLVRDGGPPQIYPGESSEIVVREATRYIGKVKKQPFFTVVWFGSPHEPYSGIDRDLALYKNAPEKLQARFAEITAMDRAMGQLREYLRTEGLGGNTLLWYCGDNGTPRDARLNMQFRGNKGEVYEGGLRVPGIIEWPGALKPRVTDVNAVTSDMLPTLCGLAGVAAAERARSTASASSRCSKAA